MLTIAFVLVSALLASVKSQNYCPDSPPPKDAHYPLVFKEPQGCNRRDCSLYIGVRVHDSQGLFLDFVMEARASGYVAIGVGNERSMDDADVFACAVNPMTSAAEAFDTYNIPEGMENVRDERISPNVCPYFTNFTDGVISCRFSRSVNITDDTEDKNLNNPYYVLYGATNATCELINGTLNLVYHERPVPRISSTRINLLKAASVPTVNGAVDLSAEIGVLFLALFLAM